MSRRSLWYRLAFSGVLLAPALLCQSLVPLVPRPVWESASEDVYAALLRWQHPRDKGPSKVVVVEADQKTIDALGWPIDRSYYVKALSRLRTAGHPWVLSFLSFQALGKAKAPADVKGQRSAGDQALAAAIAGYGRYVGTGLWFDAKADLDDTPELLRRVALTKGDPAKTELPSEGLLLAEAPEFVQGQKAFGYGTRFGLEPIVRCMQMYVTDQAQSGRFALLSGLVWAAALATDAQVVTTAGPRWPRPGEAQPYAFKRKLRLGSEECLTSPSLTTQRFLETRAIQRLSLVDLLSTAKLPALAGKIVLLTGSDLHRFRGPGAATPEDDGVVPEHLLAARFLDGLVSGDVIRRDPPSPHAAAAWLPLAGAAVLLAASAVLSPGAMVGFTLLGLAGVLGFSLWELAGNIYAVPMQTLASLAASALGLAGLYAYLRYYGVRRQVHFSAALREALSQCNTLSEVETLARQLCRAEFDECTLEFADFDRELFEAAKDANAALALLDRRRAQAEGRAPVEAAAQGGGTLVTRAGRPRGFVRLPFAGSGLEVRLAVDSKLGHLGSVRLAFRYEAYEEGFVGHLLDLLRIEVSQHWHRIKLLVDQKLLDYRYLREQTRGEIMARFLTKVLVAKFSDDRTMEENLRTVLNPRPTRAALLQADIRGYSKISAKLAPEEMVRLLQGYFRNVVDAAQLVAQVKLIGDCIFLFIEEEAARPGSSPADLALDLAAHLVAETRAQNALRGAGESLNFGIAVHYGEVVVGNLSSDSCIDYTVIGPNVNMVARLEELTKYQEVSGVLGANGVIVSAEASQALIRYKDAPLRTLDLAALGVSVRSFGQIQTVRGLSADDALALRGEAPAALPAAS